MELDVNDKNVMIKRINRKTAMALSDLSLEEQVRFVYIRNTIRRHFKNNALQVYACGSRVNGNPNLQNSAYSIFIQRPKEEIKLYQLKSIIQTWVQKKYPDVEVDIKFHEITPKIKICIKNTYNIFCFLPYCILRYLLKLKYMDKHKVR